MPKFQYETDMPSLMTQIIYAAYQDRSTLVSSYLGSRVRSDFNMAVDEVKIAKDIVRMDANRNTGVFAQGNHQNVINSLDEMLRKAEVKLKD